MTPAKHTPGPWTHDPERDSIYSASNHSIIAKIATGENRAEEDANAHLIAASPELLRACERALPWIGKMIADNAHMNAVAPNDCVGAMQQLQAAIEKARGV